MTSDHKPKLGQPDLVDRSRAASWASLTMGCLFSFAQTDTQTDRQTDTDWHMNTRAANVWKKEINDWLIKQRFLRTSIARKQTVLPTIERSAKWDVIISFISVHSSSAAYTDDCARRYTARRPAWRWVKNRVISAAEFHVRPAPRSQRRPMKAVLDLINVLSARPTPDRRLSTSIYRHLAMAHSNSWLIGRQRHE